MDGTWSLPGLVGENILGPRESLWVKMLGAPTLPAEML